MISVNVGRWSVWIAVATVGAAYAVGLRPGQRMRPVASSRPVAMTDGIDFRISEGRAVQTASAERLPEAPATRLPDDEALRILARLEPAKIQPDDDAPFALRESSTPPPRAGKTVEGIFPSPVSAVVPAVEAGALEVRRIAPQGDVDLADRITITFSQAMVPLTSHDEAAKSVPVRLTPNVAGSWRWMGTQTLVFDPGSGKRLPMATEFRVVVPAGTKALSGAVLAADSVAVVRTPAPRVLSSGPQGQGQRRDPVLWMVFDQKVDPAAILAKTALNVAGAKLRLATDTERKAVLVGVGSGVPADRVVVFKPQSPLPADTPVEVELAAGATSLEGPRATTAGHKFSFRTFAPLAVRASRCAWGNEPCQPDNPWWFDFNNEIDAEAFDPAWITVEPTLPGFSAVVQGNQIVVNGIKKGRTRYTVALSPRIVDVHGQTLGARKTVEFKIGPAEPGFLPPDGPFIVADPGAPARLVFRSRNLRRFRVRIHRVAPEQWDSWLAWQSEGRKVDALPGTRVSDRELTPAGGVDNWTETGVDLASALENGVGNALVSWDAVPGGRWGQNHITGATWVQVSKIGISAHSDRETVLVWATDLAKGTPLSGVDVRLAGTGVSGRSGKDGLARLALERKPGARIEVRRGNDTAFLPARSWQWEDGPWVARGDGARNRWFVFDDRGLYKPGETVRVKGWVRRQLPGKNGALEIPTGLTNVRWRLTDPVGNEVRMGSVPVNAWGGFDLTLDLPKTMNLGDAMLVVGEHAHRIQVQEFRRPEIEVAARVETPAPHVVRGPGIDVAVDAKYYAGGGLANADASWLVTGTPARYTPPGREGFTFGEWIPWWRSPVMGDGPMGDAIPMGRGFRPFGGEAGVVKEFSGKTDPSGTHRIHVDVDSVRPARPYSLRAEATVMDVNRQALSSSATLLVHPSDMYVGLRAAQTFVDEGKPFSLDALACDIDGRAMPGVEIKFAAFRREWAWSKGRWAEKDVDVQEWTLRSGKDPVSTKFVPKTGGSWRVRATVMDRKERPNTTELTFWVSGGPARPQRGLEQEAVELIPGKKEFAPGETATLLVRAPFAPADGLLTVRRGGLVYVERFAMARATQVVRVKVDPRWIPGADVQVDLTGQAPRSGPDGKPLAGIVRPAFASGSVRLGVSKDSLRLKVVAEPGERSIEPGGKTSVRVKVTGADGKPVVGGEVALVVVDEAVLALAGWDPGDPLSAFHPAVGSDVSDRYLRSHLLLEDPAKVLEAAEAAKMSMAPASRMVADAVPGGAMGGAMMEGRAMPMAKRARANMAGEKPEESGPVRVRTNFDALAQFTASVSTGADGVASVAVALPDNLTRYRVFAVAVQGAGRAGKGESAIVARLPLMARPSAPRFLNFGDRFELPVVVQNQTDEPMVVDVAVRASNAVLTEGLGRRVRVAANDRVEVRFPAATAKAGTARFQVVAVSGGRSDAAEVSLPVWTPATTEAFATYGVVDDGSVLQRVAAPKDAVEGFGGLEITTSSTALQELTDAWIYLNDYPYGCVEQIASRVIANVSLRDVLEAFQAPGYPGRAAVDGSLGRDLKRLSELQNDDGSFGFWSRGEKPWPWLGIHAAEAVVRARRKDVAVPEELHRRSMAYVAGIANVLPREWPESAKRVARAKALLVRHLDGQEVRAEARELLGSASMAELGPETVGWLVQVLAGDAGSAGLREAARRWFDNSAVETAGSAHFAFSYRDADYLILNSNHRADAVVLEALVLDAPKHDLIPKLVRGLLDGRRKGAWGSTQENSAVLVALDRFFRTFEGVTPDFVARVWLGDRVAAEGRFAGRSGDRLSTKVPMPAVVERSGLAGAPLVVQKDGKGRLYYRLGLRYAPKSLSLAPSDHGFAVKRTYEAVDKPSDVVRNADGSWTVKAGALVRVRVSMVSPARRYHVALVDPLPAGFEALNPELLGTGSVANGAAGGRMAWPWWWQWWEHRNLRDERSEAFASMLWEGAYEMTTICRATTPGRFVVPPAKAEEMYSPEVFGRAGTDRVEVR